MLRTLIQDLTEAVAKSAVEGIIREILNKFFKEHDLPTPAVKIVNKMGAKFLARCRWIGGEKNTTVEVQKAMMGDEAILRRVLTHELIHHWQFLRTDVTDELAMAKLGIKSDGHGESFMQYAAKINSIMGADYVTKTSDQSFKVDEVPPYYILVQPHGAGKFGYTVALRPSAKQKMEIEGRKMHNQAKLFRITDPRFTHGVPLKHNGGYGVPKDKPDHDEFLRDLYNTGTEVSLS